MPIKLVLDTDIGTDVDDAWALSFALASPEIELLLVTLVHADLDVRARIALKLIRLAGRPDVPAAKGVSETLTPGGKVFWGGHEGKGVDLSDADPNEATDDGVDRMVRAIRDNPGQITLVSIGPMTNIAAALQKDPQIAGLVGRCFIMGSNFAGTGTENAAREHNACVDPIATKTVLESGMPITLVGLNVTTKTSLRRESLARIAGRGELAEYMTAMTEVWLDVIGRDWCNMHDPLALAAVVDPAVIVTRKMSAEVLEDGSVVFSDAGAESAIDVAVDVNIDRFDALFLNRTLEFIGRSR